MQTPTLPRKLSLFNDNKSSQGEPRGRKLSFGEKQAKKRSSLSKVREKDGEKVLVALTRRIVSLYRGMKDTHLIAKIDKILTSYCVF